MKIGECIYLDHQATTPVDPRVLAKMVPYFDVMIGNPHSADHSLGWESSNAVESAAASIARLIGADTDEIIFTSGATESNNLALLGLGRRAVNSKRKRILVSAIEHKCVLSAGRILEDQYGFAVESIPVDPDGFVVLSALEEMLDDNVLAVSVLAVNNEIGTIQDIKAISKLARGFGSLVHCDAVQAPVAMEVINLAEQTDLLSLSSHKMYGPKGIGVLYVSRDLQDRIEPLIYGGEQQNGLRSGTLPTPLCVGMGAAAENLMKEEIVDKRETVRRLRDTFIEELAALSWPVVVNGARGNAQHPGNANLRFTGFSAHDILSTMQPSLAASTGSACTSGTLEPSHVLKAIGLDSDSAESSIRFSLGFGTTEQDILDAVGIIEETLDRLSRANLVYSA
ncbi:MAG: aminotransferase [Cycloclasticus sp.]|nr:aminotransferase [Cycloclasticus sp.]|tara:strand:- start:1862 stop:3049 length:1188 start_codon:yes stop_codon:yes gene_type:complete